MAARIEDTDEARDVVRSYLISAVLHLTGQEADNGEPPLTAKDKMLLVAVAFQMCDPMPAVDVQEIARKWGVTPPTVRKWIRHLIANLDPDHG
jgi:hypothetical protein